MRIIAGKLKGRLFDSPGTRTTHPMGDRMRGGLFGVLGDIEGLNVLDAFAGSGALAFEAISRGARSAVAIDSDKAAQRTIKKNISSLGIEHRCQLVHASVSGWLNTTPRSLQFDVVICDPPYHDLQWQRVKKLTERVTPSGTFVLSWPGREEPLSIKGFNLLVQKSYGDGQLLFYQRPL